MQGGNNYHLSQFNNLESREKLKEFLLESFKVLSTVIQYSQDWKDIM